jgi:adenosylhomocysteine nucleosidase
MIVILAALEVEYAAMRRQLAELQPYRHAAGTLFEVGVVAGHPGCRVALGLAGTGNARAAIMTERAITEFAPDAVLFVGVAGALRDWLALGDVVVATRVYGYHGERSEEDGSRIRPRAFETGDEILQTARHLARSTSWRGEPADDRDQPHIHFEPIASGEVVVNSRNSPTARRLDQHFNDAVAVETEGAGVAQCGHLHRDLPTITIRGISDHADGRKDSVDRTGSQELAAHHAALFARALIAAGDTTGSDEAGGGEPNPGPAGMSVVNRVYGNANTTFQAGVINGGIHIGAKSKQDPAGNES